MILPSVLEKIIIEYKDQMEHAEKVERIYQTAFRNMSQIFCPPTMNADIEANGQLNKFNCLRFGWTVKLMYYMLNKIYKLNESPVEYLARFLDEFHFLGWDDEVVDCFMSGFFDEVYKWDYKFANFLLAKRRHYNANI